MSHQHIGHKEMGPRFKVSSARPEKWGIEPVIPGLVVLPCIHYTMAATCNGQNNCHEVLWVNHVIVLEAARLKGIIKLFMVLRGHSFDLSLF